MGKQLALTRAPIYGGKIVKANKRSVLALALAGIILAVTAIGSASASPVHFQNTLVSGIYDDDNNPPYNYNTQWINRVSETVTQHVNDYINMTTNYADDSTKISQGSCDAIYYATSNGIVNGYIWNSHIGAVKPKGQPAFSVDESMQVVGSTGSSSFQAIEMFYPHGTMYYNPNPMLSDTLVVIY